MSLEFNQLVDQVQHMGRFLAHRYNNAADRLDLALKWFHAADDLTKVQERIDKVRSAQVSGYRGASLPPSPREPVNAVITAPPAPASATLIAVDGSQIYPDTHAPAQYYLINMGGFVFHHGSDELPEQMTLPEIIYTPELMEDKNKRTVSNQTINARRSVQEVETLAKLAHAKRDHARPLMALHDGGLLKFFGQEITDGPELQHHYLEALKRLRDTKTLLAGYVDVRRSTFVISLLHLLNLPLAMINDATVANNGELEGLVDAMLFARVLASGQRSALMTPNSPQNRDYMRDDPETEIAFFYLNVSDDFPANIVRVDVPMWVANDPNAVDQLQALILAQCKIQGRRRYPYALTRADELAYVSGVEKQQMDQLIRIALLNNQMQPESSSKLQTKGLARGAKRQHQLGG